MSPSQRGTERAEKNAEKTWELILWERQQCQGGKQQAGEKEVDHFYPEEVTNAPVSKNWVIKRKIH